MPIAGASDGPRPRRLSTRSPRSRPGARSTASGSIATKAHSVRLESAGRNVPCETTISGARVPDWTEPSGSVQSGTALATPLAGWPVDRQALEEGARALVCAGAGHGAHIGEFQPLARLGVDQHGLERPAVAAIDEVHRLAAARRRAEAVAPLLQPDDHR